MNRVVKGERIWAGSVKKRCHCGDDCLFPAPPCQELPYRRFLYVREVLFKNQPNRSVAEASTCRLMNWYVNVHPTNTSSST